MYALLLQLDFQDSSGLGADYTEVWSSIINNGPSWLSFGLHCWNLELAAWTA